MNESENEPGLEGSGQNTEKQEPVEPVPEQPKGMTDEDINKILTSYFPYGLNETRPDVLGGLARHLKKVLEMRTAIDEDKITLQEFEDINAAVDRAYRENDGNDRYDIASKIKNEGVDTLVQKTGYDPKKIEEFLNSADANEKQYKDWTTDEIVRGLALMNARVADANAAYSAKDEARNKLKEIPDRNLESQVSEVSNPVVETSVQQPTPPSPASLFSRFVGLFRRK